jgi:hypothetical protein
MHVSSRSVTPFPVVSTVLVLFPQIGTKRYGRLFWRRPSAARRLRPSIAGTRKRLGPSCRALLPGAGTEIKGHMRSRGELLAASGYTDPPEQFATLPRILDTELRLTTPTDPEGKLDEAGESPRDLDSPGQYYQLTRDYLVPSLRDWRTRKQRETRQGRAELKLAERAAAGRRRQPITPSAKARARSDVNASPGSAAGGHWRRAGTDTPGLHQRFCIVAEVTRYSGRMRPDRGGGWIAIRLAAGSACAGDC